MLKQDAEMKQHYNLYQSLKEIFPVNSVGIVTARDNLTVHFERDELMNTIRDFASLPVEAARQKYKLGDDAEDWRVDLAIKDIVESGTRSELAKKISYRPFDLRWTYFTGRSRGFLCRPRSNVMRNMLVSNTALLCARSNKSPNTNHFFIADSPSEAKAAESTVQSSLMPIYVISADGQRNENLSPAFRSFLDTQYDHHYSPEEILGYIYAVLHAPFYRQRYAEFLRIDFPRIPFAATRKDFDALSLLGDSLINAHLLRKQKRQGLAELKVKGSNVVEAVRYSPQEQAIYINKTQHFAPVPQNVWEFHIGGYQVIDKYLKSRKGRELSLDEINHVGAIADSLAFTIDQMAKIDVAYQAAFPLVDKA